MSVVDRASEVVQPIVAKFENCVLYDIDYNAGVLRVMVDRSGGIDVDTIGEIASQVSEAFDETDPLPDSRYILEVTSPGVERPLRTVAHYKSQLGSEVALKTAKSYEGPRRLNAVIESVSEEGIQVRPVEPSAKNKSPKSPSKAKKSSNKATPNTTESNNVEDELLNIAFDDIESARTVFNWSSVDAEVKAIPVDDSDEESADEESADEPVDESTTTTKKVPAP